MNTTAWNALLPPTTFEDFKQLPQFRATEDSIIGVEVQVRGLDRHGKVVYRFFLIGDINPAGGLCDDCNAFDGDDRVMAWRRLT
jgi:hypothetical protein